MKRGFTDQEALAEANYLLNELLSRKNVIAMSGSADPKVTANDRIQVGLENGTTDTVIVNSINTIIDINESQAIFDMHIEAHHER